MFRIVFDIGSWLLRRAYWFIGVTLILWFGLLLSQQWQVLRELEQSVEFLETNQKRMQSELAASRQQVETSTNRLTKLPHEIDKRIQVLQTEISDKEARLKELDTVMGRLNPTTLIGSTRLKIEIDLARQELNYLQEFRALSQGIPNQKTRCANLVDNHHRALREHSMLVAQLDEMDHNAGLVEKRNPFSGHNIRRKVLLNRANEVAQRTFQLQDQHMRCQRLVIEMEKGLKKIGEFKVNSANENSAIKALEKETSIFRKKVSDHWLQSLLIEPVRKVAPLALWIVVGFIVMPIGLKIVFYYVLAPLAERQRPIRLLVTESTTDIASNGETSSVSKPISLRPGEDLIVLPEFLQAYTPDDCRISAEWWLKGCGILSSYAAGMRNLTKVSPLNETSVVVSVGKDSLNELIVIDVPEGASVCLRPTHLIGIIRQTGGTLAISRQWRLLNLQAWLTLQLRYIVFHGPAKLIVKGCRGVVVQDALNGGTVSQQLTIGFSADLDYGALRAETFAAYLFGGKPLLKDRFIGPRGVYVYEEIPHPTKSGGLGSKGMDVFVDAALRVFGL
ncbi:hypothetical protein [Azonexus sp.]|uniref:hypothetical protein n=1 Tax=Azonexus sp. TaxID=1872668 RepID=UPI0035AD7C3E